MKFDVFISQATEDNDAIGRPLADALRKRGLCVWFAEDSITVGDSVRRSVDLGMRRSRYGVVILSPQYLVKECSNRELDGLITLDDGTKKVILPVWHNVSQTQIAKYSPTLADRAGVSSEKGVEHVADKIFFAIAGQTRNAHRSAIVDFISSLRSRVLTSTTERELKQCLYEVENYLTNHPTDVEARQLEDMILHAIEFENAGKSIAKKRLSKTVMVVSLLWFALVGSIWYTISRGPIYLAASHSRDTVVLRSARSDNVQIRVRWSSDNDLDLSLESPTGEQTWYGNPVTGDTNLDHDIQSGPGNETITISNLQSDGYRVVVDNYSGADSPEFTLEVIINGTVNRVYRGTVEDAKRRYVLDITIDD
ncbi:TIR domain-containing protein [bacterium]|nr:TIR domain-containing protein [bacterium]